MEMFQEVFGIAFLAIDSDRDVKFYIIFSTFIPQLDSLPELTNGLNLACSCRER